MPPGGIPEGPESLLQARGRLHQDFARLHLTSAILWIRTSSPARVSAKYTPDATAAPLDDTGKGMGVAVADYTGDGRTDIFVTNGSSRMSNDADVPVPPDRLIGRTEWDIWKGEEPLIEQSASESHRVDPLLEQVPR